MTVRRPYPLGAVLQRAAKVNEKMARWAERHAPRQLVPVDDALWFTADGVPLSFASGQIDAAPCPRCDRGTACRACWEEIRRYLAGEVQPGEAQLSLPVAPWGDV